MTLDRFASHPSFPFLNYLEDDEEFRLLATYWDALFEACLPEGEDPAQWERVFSVARDGHPILWRANHQTLRAVRIIVEGNVDNLPLMARVMDNEKWRDVEEPADDPEWLAELEACGGQFLPLNFYNAVLPNEDGEYVYDGLVVCLDMTPKALLIAKMLVRLFLRLDRTAAGPRLEVLNDLYFNLIRQHTYVGINVERDLAEALAPPPSA